MRTKDTYWKYLLPICLFGVLAGLTSCSDELYEKKETDSRYISFQPAQTRAPAINTPGLLASRTSVQVLALQNFDVAGWANLGANAKPTVPYMNVVLDSEDADGANWTYTPLKEWPLAGKLSFFAVSNNGGTIFPTASGPSFEITAGRDVMVATPVLDKGHGVSTGPVELVMQHALSRMEFSIKLASAPPIGTSVIVKDIQLGGLTGLYKIAHYNYYTASFEWDYTSAKSYATDDPSLQFLTDETNELNANSYTPVCRSDGYQFFIPQHVNQNLTLRLTYAVKKGEDETSAVKTLTFNPNTAWESGQAYNYQILLNAVTGELTIQAGYNYSMMGNDMIVNVDAHKTVQPVYISVATGFTKVTIPAEVTWARFLASGDEKVSIDPGKATCYADFGTDPNTSEKRTLWIEIDDNAPATSSTFTDRSTIVTIEHYKDATSSGNLGTLTTTRAFTCSQKAPYYIGTYGVYDPVYGYTSGLVMENFTEYNIPVFEGDDDVIQTYNSDGGLMWWNGTAPTFNPALSDNDGAGNTATITGVASNGDITGGFSARFNTYAARYCKEKGEGWYLPSPAQMSIMAGNYGFFTSGHDQNNNPYKITDGTYWTSQITDNKNAVGILRLGGTTLSCNKVSSLNTARHDIRCVKNVAKDPTKVMNPVTVNNDGTVNIETGGSKIQLDIAPDPAKGQVNFSSVGSTDPCLIRGIGWRLASSVELFYLFSVNQFIPIENKMGTTTYWVTEKSGGARGYVDFQITPPKLLFTSTGSTKGLYRCVRDL